MAKKNETTQKKVSKWEAAPKSIKDLYFAIGGVFDGLSSIIDPEEADNEEKALIELLTRVLDDYNELEAKHQKDTGMISEYEEENAQLKADLEKEVEIKEEIRQLRDGYRSCWMNADERLYELRSLLDAVDVTTSYENNDNDGVGKWTVCNKLAKANKELEIERYRFENELNYILESIESALGIQRIHLASSYDDRASYIIEKIKDDRKKYFVYESVAKSHYGLHSEGHNGPETIESLKKFLKDEYNFDVTFAYTDGGYWTLVQRGPNVFNRKSNNFRWAFRGAMECLGMSPGAIVAEIAWTSNPKVTPMDVAAKWSEKACKYYEKGEEK